MSDQLPNQKPPGIKRIYLILGTIVLLILSVLFYITYGKSTLSIPILDRLFTSCQPYIERTPNRKTGVVAIENRDGTFTDVTLYQSGEKNIISNYILEESSNVVKLNNLYLRGGKIIGIDKKNNVIFVNVGDGYKMVIQITKDQLIRVKRAKVLFGRPTFESFINNAKLCHIQEGDAVGLLVNQSNLKLYDKAFVVPAVEIIQ